MAKKFKSPSHQDLNTIISETGVADGAFTWSETIYNMEHVKRLILHIKATKAYEIYITKINQNGQADWSNLIVTGLGASSPSYSGYTVDATTSIVGYACKIGFKNLSGDASTADFDIKMQALN